MSHPHCCSCSFHYLLPETPLDTSDPRWEISFTQRVKQRHAMNTGRPYSKATYPTDRGNPFDSDWGAMLRYCDGKIAWSSARGLTVLCLKTGMRTSLTTENREYIKDMEISESIAAAISTRGYVPFPSHRVPLSYANYSISSVCHVWSLSDGQTRNFRLPSLNISRFVVSGDKVIMHFHTGSLLIWDYETQAAMETPLSQRPDAIILNQARNSLSIIHVEDTTNPSDSACLNFQGVTLLEYSIVGTKIYQSVPPTSLLEDCPFFVFYMPDRDISVPCVVLNQWFDPTADQPQPHPTRYVLFDFSSGSSRPSVHTSWDLDKDSVSTPQVSIIGDRTVTMPGGLIYHVSDISHSNGDLVPEVVMYDLRSSSYSFTEIASIERELLPSEENKNWARSPRSGSDGSRCQPATKIFGDDEFLCLIDDKRVTVFCFDEHVSMAGEDPGYREIRNRRAEQRAEQQNLCA